MRPMIGGRAARNRWRFDRRRSRRCRIAMTFVGISSVGSAPLPTWEVESSSET